jgi:hypothetical protein
MAIRTRRSVFSFGAGGPPYAPASTSSSRPVCSDRISSKDSSSAFGLVQLGDITCLIVSVAELS